ncbi:MAG: hypothetical protein H7A37_06710 [Chlamydiales bacterium]|nr:hypothetical protein [Chlamydiales bacterium]
MVQRAFFDFWFSVYQGDPASSIDCFAKGALKAEFTINDKAVPGADNAEQYLAMAKETSDALRWIQSFNLSVTSFSPKTNTMTVKYDQHLVVENKIEGKLVWLKMHSHGTENITYKLNEEKTQAVFTKIVCKETDEMEVMTPEEKEHLVNNIQEPETYSWWNPVSWFSK